VNSFKKWYFEISNYHKYGLYTHDIADEDFTAEIAEAVRRMPADQLHARSYRQIRASQLEITKEYLPKEQWISYEDDQANGRYLQPLIDEVLAEWKEKADWEQKFN
jgi:hypothetical protein